ncbi:hypothetical protein CR205_11740 [Alteribacter lacisalsi]|uniref:Ferric siderophore reductase C-terminal domain-containing protein n=1 Tax=Alteribacter lacisalsi TaxID=2045244 RepID=A0A2W0H8I0_9BACI|nr:(2Fe-2S)-binding protein [Alteribacter lacisalsi]PYZ96390.1 hypothetical protein CR205_11740 [Alteribacter lacisalsi]
MIPVADFTDLEKQTGLIFTDQLQEKSDHTIAELIRSSEHIRCFTDNLHTSMKSPNSVVTGTIFGKRYAALVRGLFTAGVYGWSIDASPEQTVMLVKDKAKLAFMLDRSSAVPSASLTHEETEARIVRFISGHLDPLFYQIAEATGAKRTHMHSLVAHSLYQTAHKLRASDNGKKEAIGRMLDLFLIEGSPLSFHFQLSPDGEYYIRKHCCLAYLLKGGSKDNCCGTCPHINL